MHQNRQDSDSSEAQRIRPPLSQEIEDAFQEQKLVLVSWIDLQKAFDKVWMEGLLVKLLRNGIASNIFNWIKSCLYNRRVRVSTDRIHSKKMLLRHGVPQGGVLSPTSFLLFINDLVSELPKGVKAALYADDLVIWCKEEYATTATYRMQLAADKLNSWTEKWCVTVNKDKSSTTLFILPPKQKAGTITLGGTPLKEEEEATYLGITFDKRQTWKQHIAKAEAKARRRLAILLKLAGTTWGSSEKILKTVYRGKVRPQLEYGSSAWSTTAKTNQQALDKVQNQARHSSDHWCNAVHTDHRNGEAHRSPTSWSTEGCQEHDAGRKVQVLDKPSHENQAGMSHQESAKKKQFCP